jgi:hypothetical protein
MNRELEWTEPLRGPLVLRQPSDGAEDENEADDLDEGNAVDDFKSQMADLRRDLEKQISGRFSKEKRAMSREIDELKAALSKAEKAEESQREELVEEGSKSGDDLSPGMKAQMAKLQKQLDKLQGQNDDLARAAQEKELQMKLERRKHSIESELTNLNAVRPEQAYRIIQDMIVDDEEIGDAIPVKTDHGDDLVPVKEYLSTFKEENPHLFAVSAKSGSGAGGGGAAQGRPKYSKDALSDPKSGGMDWSTYEKNREAIHREFEGKAGL